MHTISALLAKVSFWIGGLLLNYIPSISRSSKDVNNMFWNVCK